jgi:methylenetetrahydrofolate dehydrogenase (NADP+) / methenyltetrahydrofolate cyclohydrolase
MILIDGNKVAAEMKQEIAAQVTKLKLKGGKTPHLAAVLVGHDGGSETYVAYKIKDCEAVGFKSSLIRYEDDVTESELLAKVRDLNENPDIDGFIVQLPLPAHISEQKVIETIDPKKDVDGFHPENVGRMVIGLPSFVSATPFGIVELLKHYSIETSGKNCVIVGRSNIVGRPLSILMSQKAINATVTVAHSRTKKLAELCSSADILVAAIGVPEFIKGNMVKKGAVVIDVGTSRVKSDQTKSGWKLKGDVLFDEVLQNVLTLLPCRVG